MTQNRGFRLHSLKGIVTLGVALLVVALLAAFAITRATRSSGDDGAAGTAGANAVASFGKITQPALDTAVQGLCQARSDLQKGDVAAARQTFYDKSHLQLHQLAAQVQDRDINLATGLLVAKYQVENVLPLPGQTPVPATGPAADEPPAQLVTQLLGQVQQSAKAIGLMAPQCTQ